MRHVPVQAPVVPFETLKPGDRFINVHDDVRDSNIFPQPIDPEKDLEPRVLEPLSIWLLTDYERVNGRLTVCLQTGATFWARSLHPPVVRLGPPREQETP